MQAQGRHQGFGRRGRMGGDEQNLGLVRFVSLLTRFDELLHRKGLPNPRRAVEQCQFPSLIRRHNEHIEKCNRVIEAQEAGLSLSERAVGSEVEALRAEIQETAAKLAAPTQEGDQLNMNNAG